MQAISVYCSGDVRFILRSERPPNFRVLIINGLRGKIERLFLWCVRHFYEDVQDDLSILQTVYTLYVRPLAGLMNL